MTNVSVPPYAECMTVEEAKLHLKIEEDTTEDDDLIASLLAGCRSAIEARTGANLSRMRSIMATTFQFKLNCFPGCAIDLPRSPVLSVSSITYVDTDGNPQTLSSSYYTLDRAGSKIDLNYGYYWPSARYQANAVTVTFVAGLAASFTADADDGTYTVFGRTLADGDRVRVMNSGGILPAGLSTGTDYFVVDWNSTDHTFNLSEESGGTAIAVSDDGTGVHYILEDPGPFVTLQNAIKLLLSHLYYNRQAVVVTPGIGAMEIPFAVDALVNSVSA